MGSGWCAAAATSSRGPARSVHSATGAVACTASCQARVFSTGLPKVGARRQRLHGILPAQRLTPRLSEVGRQPPDKPASLEAHRQYLLDYELLEVLERLLNPLRVGLQPQRGTVQPLQASLAGAFNRQRQ